MKSKPNLNFQLKNPLKNLSKKKKILLAVIVVVLVAAIGTVLFMNSRKNHRPENMEAAITLETAKIERQTLTNSISATGTVESAETKTVNTSLKDIEVVAVYVKEGDYVEEGTIICEFDASDYEEALAEAQHNASINSQIEALSDYTTDYEDMLDSAFDSLNEVATSKNDAQSDYEDAEDELDDAEDDLADAKAAYNKAKAEYEANKTEIEATEAAIKTYSTAYSNAQTALADAKMKLEIAKAADPDSTDYQTNVTAAEGDLRNAENTLATAESNYNTASARYNELQKIKSAYDSAKAKYDSAKAAVSQAESNLEKAESSLEQAEDRLDSAWETYDDSVERAEQEYTKSALQDQLISESQEEKAMNEYTELIDDCVVRATMSGVITSLNVTEGNVFEGGDVYTIQDNEHFIVSSAVDEYDISSIEKGMSAYIKTDATGDVEMTGEVTYVAIAPAGNGAMGAISNSASYTIKVTIDEADVNLRAGMTAKISIALEESADTLTVPYDAVTTGPDGDSTITIDADGEKKTITVKTGLETDYYTEIISDEISEGMTVYLTTPMVRSGSGDEEDRNALDGLLNGITGGGGMPAGGDGMPSGGGGRPSGGGGERPSGSGGGMPSGGGPGGF